MLQSLSGVRPTGVPVSRMACEQQFKRVAIVGGAADKNDGDRPMKQLIAGAAFAAAVSFAGAAAADTVLSYTGPADGVAPVTETLPTRGQIITVPEGATALRSFTLWGLGPARSVVRTYSNGQIGPVRYAGPNKVVASRDSERTETLSTPLAVTPGEQLFIGVQYVGPTNAQLQIRAADVVPNSTFADLDAVGRTSTGPYDSRFIATFATATTPAPVPTMSEWAMIILGTMLAGSAALYIQRRKQAV